MERRQLVQHTEDWWAVWLGLGVTVLSLGVLAGVDLLGWGAATSVWLRLGGAVAPVSKVYARLPGAVSLLATYGFLLALTATGARALKFNLKEFAVGFTVIFWVSYACWLIGNFAYIAATPDKLPGFKIPWALGLTGEAGFLVALLAGLAIGNFFPRVTRALQEATRPEWYIKTAIVILGASLGVQAAGATGLAKKPGVRVSAREIWERFPKFVIGYFATFLAMLAVAIWAPSLLGAARIATAESNVFRVLFFVMTFFTIGLVTDFRRLWQEGFGKLALVYVVCLFGFIIWIGLVISWVFFRGILRHRPRLAVC